MRGTSRWKARRGAVPPPPGSRLGPMEQLDLVGITLLVGVDGRRDEVPGLALHFDAAGMAVRRWDGADAVRIAWASLRRFRPLVISTKNGSSRIELEIETDRRTHRFVVPNVDPEVLRNSLLTASTRYARPEMVERVARKTVRQL